MQGETEGLGAESPGSPETLLREDPEATRERAGSCLYCLRPDGGFQSPEHILPESLGNREPRKTNREHILAPGVVCDRCNHGPLSLADSDFLAFHPVAMLRTAQGVRRKDGRLPSTRFANASLHLDSPTKLIVTPVSKKGVIRRIPGGITMSLVSRKLTPAYLARITRFLHKAALGYIYADHGPAVAMGRAFDEVRRIALGEPFHGYLLMAEKAKPSRDVTLMYGETASGGRSTIRVVMDVYGFGVGTDLISRQPPNDDELPPGLVALRF